MISQKLNHIVASELFIDCDEYTGFHLLETISGPRNNVFRLNLAPTYMYLYPQVRIGPSIRTSQYRSGRITGKNYYG